VHPTQRRDAAAIFDPRTYIEDVPFAALARFRRQHGVVCGSTSRPC
jgi:hypothetical protein